jgi:hypothetical protein
MSDFQVFIEEEDMYERFIQEVMCEGYYGYDFMDDKNPMKNVFMRWCIEQYQIKQEEDKLDEEDEKMNKMEAFLNEKMNELEEKKAEVIKRYDDLPKQGKKEVENETI